MVRSVAWGLFASGLLFAFGCEPTLRGFDGNGGGASSSSSGAGGMAGMGGMGGGAPACTVPQDCPMAETPACRTNTQCSNGLCLWVDLPEGTPVPGVAQTYGDCITIACDGVGRTNDTFADVNDKYVWGNSCFMDTCGPTPLSKGPDAVCVTSWGTMGHCDGNLRCTECATDVDCGANVCMNGKCVPNHCVNAAYDQGKGETDMDCGGPCVPCAIGKTCALWQDCEGGGDCSGVPSKICSAPSCSDLFKNGDETDSDCGGSCATKCSAGMGCLYPKDCASGQCVAGVCQ